MAQIDQLEEMLIRLKHSNDQLRVILGEAQELDAESSQSSIDKIPYISSIQRLRWGHVQTVPTVWPTRGPVLRSFSADLPSVFIDGATVSGLAFNGASNVAYSNQPGGTVTGYSPLAPFDPAVTGIRFSPSGTLRASNGTAHPSFTLRYRMVIE